MSKTKRSYWISPFFLCIILFLLSGCRGKQQGMDSGSAPENPIASESLSFLTFDDLPWRDNSLDAYSAQLLKSVRFSDQNSELGRGVTEYFLGKDCAMVFCKHFSEKGNWDELKIVTDQGEETSHRLNFWKDLWNQAWMVGTMYDSSHYLMMTILESKEEQRLLYQFFETDETLQLLRTFYVEGMDQKEYELPVKMLVDKDGYIHILSKQISDGKMHYYISRPEGGDLIEVQKTILERQNSTLFYLNDGRVGLRVEQELSVANMESGSTKTLVDSKLNFEGAILWEENTLLYADSYGLHRCNLSGGEKETLYQWNNHGILFTKMIDLQRFGDQIGILYDSQEGLQYLKLAPTTEEVPILEIEFAASSSAMQRYQAVAAAFNRKHPTYRVKMTQHSYNDTRLSVQLMAGEGPQLLDTNLVGFSDHAEMWLPLDDFYKQLGLDEQLIPQTVKIGQIDGTSYGVVTSFGIHTLVSFAELPEEWNYETFLNALTEDGKMKYVLNLLNGSDGSTLTSVFFFHGLDETYLYDAEKCTTNFDSEAFHKILQLAQYHNQRNAEPSGESLRDGDTLCAVVYIDDPDIIAALRIWGKDKLQYVGYPTQNGAVHYLSGTEPLCIRRNATTDEKRLALTFLSYLLSYDGQKEAFAKQQGLSVRKDVLQEQIEQVNEYSYPVTRLSEQFYLGDQVDNERDGKTLWELLENARPKQYRPRELSNIMREEIDAYLEGTITEEILIQHLTQRVQLYLNEQKTQS